MHRRPKPVAHIYELIKLAATRRRGDGGFAGNGGFGAIGQAIVASLKEHF